MKYKFIKDGKEEEIPLEKWHWETTYNDGTKIKQFDDATGVFHQIGEVKEGVKMFSLLEGIPGMVARRLDIFIPEGGKPIHKYRIIVLNAGTPDEQRVKVFIIGYKKGKQHLYNFVLPNGDIVQTDTDKINLGVV